MYIYNVSQYEPYSLDLFLVHEKKFTQEEFEKMCDEIEIKYKYSHALVVCNYLKEKYNFKGIGDCIVGYYEYNMQ